MPLRQRDTYEFDDDGEEGPIDIPLYDDTPEWAEIDWEEFDWDDAFDDVGDEDEDSYSDTGDA